MNKKALANLEMIMWIIIAVVGMFAILSYTGIIPDLFSFFAATTKTPFDNVCCCKADNDKDCSELFRKECEETAGFVVMDDMKKCEVT